MRHGFADELTAVEQHLPTALTHAPETPTLVAEQLLGHRDYHAQQIKDEAERLRQFAVRASAGRWFVEVVVLEGCLFAAAGS